MTNRLEIYRCKTCNNIIQVLIEGEGELYCCGHPMEKMEKQTQESGNGEYHVPVKMYCQEKGPYIQVGKDPHPMTDEHHIEFIQIVSDDKKCVKTLYLEPEQEPKMYLKNEEDENFCMLELCNIHGLWGGKNA